MLQKKVSCKLVLIFMPKPDLQQKRRVGDIYFCVWACSWHEHAFGSQWVEILDLPTKSLRFFGLSNVNAFCIVRQKELVLGL